MSVFLCWSGTRSELVADAVKGLLHRTVDALKEDDDVFISGSIAKGMTWFDSIIEELKRADAGIACVTAENLHSPWMHFEAGALAREISDRPMPPESPAATGGTGRAQPATVRRSRLFTVLHGVTAAELDGPLSAYQGTGTTLEDMSALVRALRVLYREPAGAGDVMIPEDVWDAFALAVRHAVVPVRTLIAGFGELFQRKTFNEPVQQCADKAWLDRYDGARITRETLRPHRDRVRSACRDHERGLFEMLLTELDAYAMAIDALLLMPVDFTLGDDGELEMDAGIQTSCEDRRLAIRSLVGRLMHPFDEPLLPESVWFLAAGTNEERKMFIHRLEGRIRREREETYEDVAKGSSGTRVISAALGKLTDEYLQKALERQEAVERAQRLTKRRSAEQESKEKTGPPPAPVRLLRFRESSWDLDRIYYYLIVQYFGVHALMWESNVGNARPEEPSADAGAPDNGGEPEPRIHDLFCAARDVEMEIERYRARAKGGSLTPLTYALVALQTLKPARFRSDEDVRGPVSAAISLVTEELAGTPAIEPGRPIARLLADIW